MKAEVVCILSDVRSGSTLLEQLLGAHSGILSVGEVQWLQAYAKNDRLQYNPPHELVCACGSHFDECQFWQGVSRNIDVPFHQLELIPRYFPWTGPGRVKQPLLHRIPRRIVEVFPSMYRAKLLQEIFSGSLVAQHNMKVFAAIDVYSSTNYIVDTSKNIFRFRSIFTCYPERIRTLVLYRDYRAVIYSRMKRGVSLKEAAQNWALKARQIEALTKGVASNRIMSVRYEDLCIRTRQELERVCRFLGLDFEPGMLDRYSEELHDLGGSPSKFKAHRREIRLDKDYLAELSTRDLEEIKAIVGPLADKYQFV